MEQRRAAEAPGRAAEWLAESGIDFSFGAVELSGAPARINLAVATPRLANPEAGWSWSSERLDVDRLVYRMSAANLLLEGPHYLSLAAADDARDEVRIEGLLRGGAETEDGALARVSLRGSDLGVGAEPGAARRATLMELQLCAPTIAGADVCGEGAPAIDADAGFPLLVFLRMESLALGDGGRAYARLIGVAYLDAPIRLDAPAPSFVALHIEEAVLRLAQEEGDHVDVTAAGTLEMRDGTLQGRLSVEADEAAAALERLVSAGVLSETSAAALRPWISESGRLAAVLEIDADGWRILDLGLEPIALTRPD